MSTGQLTQFAIGRTVGELSMRKPEWWHHLLAWVYISSAMLLTYGLALEGVSMTTMLLPAVIAITGLLYLYGERLDYLHFGDRIKIGLTDDEEETREVVLDEHEKE